MAIKSPAGAVPQADQIHQGARAGLLGHRHLVAGQQFLFLVQRSDFHPDNKASSSILVSQLINAGF